MALRRSHGAMQYHFASHVPGTPMLDHLVQNWHVRKPAAQSRGGIVATQNRVAGEAGLWLGGDERAGRDVPGCLELAKEQSGWLWAVNQQVRGDWAPAYAGATTIASRGRQIARTQSETPEGARTQSATPERTNAERNPKKRTNAERTRP